MTSREEIDAFVTEHCTTAVIEPRGEDNLSVLVACRYCGSLLWDVPLHMSTQHGLDFDINLEGSTP